ncbi:hypothetical protein [Runella sp.]|uniref:hypothetical protein n=1 Tax=Runella sp. TaxID=1960881 RepID=UPI00261A8B16|nr:hypothetical protein [Runella sp.]
MKKISGYPLLIKVFLLFPIAVFCIFLGYFAVNVPQGDDFELILHFLSKYVSAGNDYAQKISLLTAQFVEHRLFYTRIVVLIQYLLTGQVSFYLIILLGNLSLLGIFIVCWKQLKTAGYSLLYLLPISLIIFQPCYSYDGVLWPAATLAYNSVSFFAILTIHWLSTRRSLHFWLALASAALCTYTFGNGIVVLMAGLGLLVIQKRWKYTLIWIAISALIIGFYFQEYVQIQSRNNPFQNIITHPFYVFANFLVFLGSALNWDESWPKFLTSTDIESLVGGGIVLIIACVVFYRSFKSLFISLRTPNSSLSDFLFGGFTFFVLTGLLICFSRVNKDELLLYINRYRINSVAVLVLGYLSLLPFLKQRTNLYSLFLGGLIGFWLLSYFNFYAVFSEYKRIYISGQYNWATAHEWFIYRDTSYWERASGVVMEQAKSNLGYTITQSPFSRTIDKEEMIKGLKISKLENKKTVSIEGKADSVNHFGWGKDCYIAFKNKEKSTTYLIHTLYNRRSIRFFLLGQSYYYPVFHASLTYRHFPTGKYQIGIATEQNKVLTIRWQPFTFDAIQESNITH